MLKTNHKGKRFTVKHLANTLLTLKENLTYWNTFRNWK